jgi:hypothetical protein
MRVIALILSTALAAGLGSCSQEQSDYSDQQRSCISQRYKDYDAKQLTQCVDVCRSCLNGTIATCNSSCKLRGAT